MKRIWRPRTVGLGLAFLLLAGTATDAFPIRPREGPVGEEHRPVVEAIAAQNEIGNGYLWKIYVRASDPDGDLDKIQVMFSQLGHCCRFPK